MTYADIAIAWFIAWAFTWPALLAYFQRFTPDMALQSYRDDLRISMILALLPPAWIAAAVLLIRYRYGFRVFPQRASGRSLRAQ